MKILAIDSTAVSASVALCDGPSLLGLYTINNGNTHSQTLLPMAESLLKQSGLTPKDIELYAVSNGPGSFTGVRIGCATVKGLAFGLNVPCAGVSTLEALAYNLIGSDGIICPVMNARRGQVYNALFECKDGALVRLCPDRALAIKDLAEELLCDAKYEGRKIYLVGDGYDITKDAFPAERLGAYNPFMCHQNAYSVAMCALAAHERGESVSDSALAPTYLRPSQAEREHAERLKSEGTPN